MDGPEPLTPPRQAPGDLFELPLRFPLQVPQEHSHDSVQISRPIVEEIEYGLAHVGLNLGKNS